jgi:hypothetical protein
MGARDGLAALIEEARLGHRARYILVAVIDGEEYDVGETVLGPTSEVDEIQSGILTDIRERLLRLGVSEAKIGGATLRALEAPLLY